MRAGDVYLMHSVQLIVLFDVSSFQKLTEHRIPSFPILDKLYHWNYARPAENRPKSLSAGRPKSDFDGNQ